MVAARRAIVQAPGCAGLLGHRAQGRLTRRHGAGHAHQVHQVGGRRKERCSDSPASTADYAYALIPLSTPPTGTPAPPPQAKLDAAGVHVRMDFEVSDGVAKLKRMGLVTCAGEGSDMTVQVGAGQQKGKGAGPASEAMATGRGRAASDGRSVCIANGTVNATARQPRAFIAHTHHSIAARLTAWSLSY